MNNNIRDIVIDSIEMSRRSKVPVIFVSNPGFGKTTTLSHYAELNGYHLETLIGSGYTKDEILGFQVNEGGPSLVSKDPDWYASIMDYSKKGIPSILFLDELTGASAEVQLTLLDLCFARHIRGNKYLPEDCIICAAGNYKLNLPGWCDVTAPSLNRFCLINVQSNDDLDTIDEFLQVDYDPHAEWPTFANAKADTDKVVKLTNQMFKGLWKKYPRTIDSSLGKTMGALNLNCQDLNSVYDNSEDGSSPVLNFVSPRTMSYTARCLEAMASMGISSKNRAFVSLVVDGLVGLGSNLWSDDPDERRSQIDAYRALVQTKACDILDRLSKNNAASKGPSMVYATGLQGKISEAIATDELNDLDEIVKEVNAKYTHDIASSLAFLNGTTTKLSEFTSDFEAILRMVDHLKANYDGDSSYEDAYNSLKVMLKTYSFVYQSSFIQNK